MSQSKPYVDKDGYVHQFLPSVGAKPLEGLHGPESLDNCKECGKQFKRGPDGRHGHKCKPIHKKPVVKLSGQDGNAFYILGACQRAAKKAGWDAEKIKSVMDEMRGGDYNNLLATAMKHFDVD